MNTLEAFLHEITKFFLTPVLVVLCLMFVLSLFYLGTLLFELMLRGVRRAGRAHADALCARQPVRQSGGAGAASPEADRAVAHHQPRCAHARAGGDHDPHGTGAGRGVVGRIRKGIASNLVVAFSAVIVALLAAAITFTVLSIRRRWLLEELNELLSRAAGANGAPMHLTEVAHG